MEKIEALKMCSLFRGMEPDEIKMIVEKLDPIERSYPKGDLILRRGDVTESLGVLTEGRLLIITEDFDGNRNIISEIGQGEIFAEVFGSIEGAEVTVDVEAAENSRVLWIRVRDILEIEGGKPAMNLLSTMARKNLMLNRKMEHICRRTTREKLMSYLTSEMIRRGSSTFRIPFDRQGLADYLSVNRSAMSKELSEMKRDGLIDYKKNRFTLHATREI